MVGWRNLLGGFGPLLFILWGYDMTQMLRKKGTDEMYVHTALLAERGDMELVADDEPKKAPVAPAVADVDELESLLATPKKRK